MRELGLQTIAVAEIDDSDRLRSVDDGHVCLLAENIEQVGQLLQPIAVRRLKKGGFKLIAGGHRLAAARKLDWAEIPAFVFDATDDEARLAEIDENLVRHELNPLDRATFLHERKALYEKLHPETKRGGDRGNQHTGGKDRQTEIISFSRDTAERVGLTDRTVRMAVMIATRLAPDVKARIVGTALARNQSELLTLAKLPPEEQRLVAAELLSAQPRAKNVSGAHRLILGKQTNDGNPDDKAFLKFMSLWGRIGAPAKRNIIRHLKENGDLTKYGPGRRGNAADEDEGGEE